MEQRRRQAAESLLTHSLFSFQVHDAALSQRLLELRELLLATCGERDQIGLLSESIREIEEQLQAHSERFLLEPLQRFEQEMELLLDVGSGDEGDVDEEEEDEECWSQEVASVISNTPCPSPPVTPIAKQRKLQVEEEMLCGVCCAPDSLETDPIVICDVCGVAVHQTCYRLATLPEGDWYCHPCRQYLDSGDIEKNLLPTHELECEACCTKAGAMAPTVDGKWVHVACSMFLPELYVQDKHTSRFSGPLDGVQVVCGVEKLRARRKLRCFFCRKSNEKGACAQCVVGKCTVAYHALCALRNGIKIRYMEDQGQFGSGCMKHQAKFLNMGGESETDAVDESSKSTAKPTTKRSRKKKSWSDEDESEIEEASDEIDSDSEHNGSEDSLSDDEQHQKDGRVKSPTQPTPTKKSPPRLLGGPPLRKSGAVQTNKLRRNRQIKLSFASAGDITAKTTSPSKLVPATAPMNPISATPGTAPRKRNDDIQNSRLVLQANTFTPTFYPPTYKPEELSEQEFEYVMILITTRPLGLGIASSQTCPGIFLHAERTTNTSVVEAIRRGVIQNGDELFAFNEQIQRNSDIETFKEKVAPALQLPVSCWFRTKRKSTNFAAESPKAVVAVANAANTLVSRRRYTASAPVASPPGSVSLDVNNYSARPGQNGRGDDSGIVSLGIDWPWVFLRSDGKLAMNLFWKSLDPAFFIRKMNKRTFAQLQANVEDMCGVRLNNAHPEYELVRELLVMPRRERIPAYLVEFRSSRQQKQTFLSSDILMGVSSESKGADAEANETTSIEVGTTVTVEKRTWPGMNKLGGVGRIKKVNEKTLPEGSKRFTYNIVYVMGGKESNVERKWITVVDLDAEEADKSEETTGRRQKSEPEPDVKEAAGEDKDVTNVRLSFAVNPTTDEEKLAVLPDAKISSPPKRRKFHLQFSTANATVHCERKCDSKGAEGHDDPSVTPAKELLLHRHFEVKPPEIDALTNACFSSELKSFEDRVGDEVDEDDTDSEGKADEITTELATLQSQFRAVMESNEQAFTYITKKVDEEYAEKEYRRQELHEIQWRNYKRMYQELHAAKRQFDDSDDESNENEDGRMVRSTAGKSKKRKIEDEDSENEDISFGGMFVNKLKQEGNEVCALCELSGGDFTGTNSGEVVHPQCAMFTPETFFKDGVVHGIDLVDPERQQLKCSICGGRKGLSKIQCANRKCVQAFHVACAFVNGLLTRDPYYQAWCPRHLKSSGMVQFVELPDHLHKKDNVAANTDNTPSVTPASSPARRNQKSGKQRSSRKKKSRGRQETTPAEASTASRAAISSSKTKNKRKRKSSNAAVSANTSSKKSARGNRGGSPRSAIPIEEQEPRCVRRLDIDELGDDSDDEGKAVEAWQQGRDTNHVFLKNDVVEVLGREWRGINKPGGVARVRAVEVEPNQNGGRDVFYDVNYILGAYKEKHLAARFVRSYIQSSDD